MNWIVTVGLALALGAQETRQEPATDQAEIQSTQEELVTDSALADLIRDVYIPAREPGVLERLLVKEGDWVTADQPIAELDQKLYKIEVEAALKKKQISELKATDDVDMRYSTKSQEVADATLERSQAAVEKFPNSISMTEIEQLRLELERATLSIEKAEFEKRLAGYEAELNGHEAAAAQVKLEQRTIRSPIAGLVVEILPQEGEWLNSGQSIIRVLQLDRMRIKAALPGDQINQSFVGRKAEFESGINGAIYSGTIHFVSPEIPLGFDKVEFWFDVDNPDRLLRRREVGRVRVLPEK